MGENQFPTSNQSIEQIMQSPRQAGNFAGRPPMRPPNGNNPNQMSNNGIVQLRAYQQAQMAIMNQAGFVRPNPFQTQQMSMMNMSRGPVNPFSPGMSGMMSNQNFQTPPGMMNMGIAQPPQMTALPPPNQAPNPAPQPAPQNSSRLPPTPSTPAPPLSVASSVPKSSHPPSRSASIPPVAPGSFGAPREVQEEVSEIDDLQGDHIFRDCLEALLGPEQENSDTNYWTKLVNNFFSPKAIYRHQYLGSGPNSRNHEFLSEFCMLPYMLQSSFNSGSTKTKFILSQPKFQRNGSFLRITYGKSEIVNQHPQAWAFLETSISIVFEGNGKMLAWDFVSKGAQEYISRTSLEQYVSSIKPRTSSTGNTENLNPASDFNSAFPPLTTDSSISRGLVDKLEVLSSTSLLAPLVEIQCALKRPISACCEMYFKDFGQPTKGSLPSSNSTPVMPNSRVTPKPRATPSNSTASIVMSPLNPVRQITNGSTLSLDSPSSQPDSAQTSFSLTPLQATSDLVDSSAPSKRGKGNTTAKGAPRKPRTAGNSTRARKPSSSTSKTPKTEDG
ncbi:hypothetical protein DSO57_1015806 [Entomophthora muscae]|uniref:Uncharacterized protein n=1 Tax=Entomophthora muscae TaxID=34485 RepID=A0ACC2U345_9FUNG|nr:hypothetical protein DSO57_1015806 [Entomophthora muscae]